MDEQYIKTYDKSWHHFSEHCHTLFESLQDLKHSSKKCKRDWLICITCFSSCLFKFHFISVIFYYKNFFTSCQKIFCVFVVGVIFFFPSFLFSVLEESLYRMPNNFFLYLYLFWHREIEKEYFQWNLLNGMFNKCFQNSDGLNDIWIIKTETNNFDCLFDLGYTSNSNIIFEWHFLRINCDLATRNKVEIDN